MAYLDFIKPLHKSTKRDYLKRVMNHNKATCAEIAIQFDKDYRDGERHLGYGGYRYDGRWRPVAEAMATHYGLRPGARILDVGCGKGFLLYEFSRVVPDAQVFGLDISRYELQHAKEELRGCPVRGTAAALPFADRQFDLVYSINTLHNLYNYEVFPALQELERVGCGAKHIVVESYRNEREKVNPPTGRSPAAPSARRASGSGGSTRRVTRATTRSSSSSSR